MARAGTLAALAIAGIVPLACAASEGPASEEPSGLTGAERARLGVKSSLRAPFVRTADGFTVRLRETRFQRPELLLPRRLDRAFSLIDHVSGAAVDVSLVDSRLIDAKGELSDGVVKYRGRAGGVVHSARRNGTEDHVTLWQGEPVVRYRLGLGAGIVALRKIGSFIELLDRGGAPRIRVSAPFVADARGARHPVEIGIEGCRYDSDPKPPWGRTIPPTGSRSCTLRMSWDGERVGLPAVLDPIWSLTGDMARARQRFGLVALNSGKVLAAGGTYDTDTELYDPATGTWALTGPTSSAFPYCTATHLSDDRVLLVTDAKSTTYDPSTGQWTNAGALAVPRMFHAAELLSNGKVLVAGGRLNTTPYQTDSAELFAPATGTWSSTGKMTATRRDLTLTALPGGRVLAASGATAEIYDEASATWSAAAAPPSSHSSHTAQKLASGKVLLIGGSYSKKSDIFDPTANAWIAGPDLAWERWDASSVLLSNGDVVVTGGWDEAVISGEVEDAERYVPNLNQWIHNGVLQYLRLDHRSAPLANGEAIVAGGGSVNIDVIDMVERLSLLSDGSSCTAAGDCKSAFCVGGMCCDEACSGTCRTCRANQKASGADGVCGFAKAGVDPANQCPDQGAPSCGTTGACDGAGGCAKYPSGTACAAPVCQSGALQSSACSAQGVCVQSSQSCAPYVCADGVSCGTTCTLDQQCQAPATCDTASGKCVAPQANGASCASNAQCTSGQCVDGVCCDSACAEPCKACSAQKKGGGSDGQCGNIVAGADPDGDCPTDSPQSCQRDGMCSGTGGCRLYPAGTVCGLTACVGNQQVGAACDGTGTCNASTSADCGAYACAGSSCNTSCATSGDCAADAWCDSGACQPRLTSGTACSTGDQCESGFCVDGVCCQTPCTGQCAACDTAGALGLCVPVKGAPHGARPACPAAVGGPCSAKTCDGVERESCNAFVGAEVECRAGSCDQGVASLAAQCDGFGSCPAVQSSPCAPYACGADSCKSTCTTDADCSAGVSCSVASGQCVAGAICTGPSTLRDATGAVLECAPYACSAGTCRESCGSIQDCSPGYVCSAAGKCAAASSGAGDDGGCALAPASKQRLPGLLLLALALALTSRRRRHA